MMNKASHRLSYFLLRHFSIIEALQKCVGRNYEEEESHKRHFFSVVETLQIPGGFPGNSQFAPLKPEAEELAEGL